MCLSYQLKLYDFLQKKCVFKLSVKTVRVKEKEEFSKINKEKKGKNEMSKKYLS